MGFNHDKCAMTNGRTQTLVLCIKEISGGKRPIFNRIENVERFGVIVVVPKLVTAISSVDATLNKGTHLLRLEKTLPLVPKGNIY